MKYSILIDLISNESAQASYYENDLMQMSANYTYNIPSTTNLFSQWQDCSNSFILSIFEYFFSGISYSIQTYSTYLNDATASCPNMINIINSNPNDSYFGVSLYSYTSKCNSANSLNSFIGNYNNNTASNLTYDISTNIVSNINCNINLTSVTTTPGDKNTTYNFYNNTGLILTIQINSTYNTTSGWNLNNITLTNYNASNADAITAIAFLSNMYYNLSYYNYSKNLNNCSLNCQLLVVNSLAPIIQIFNTNL